MINIQKLISEYVTFRQNSMFLMDIEKNAERIREEVEGKSLCVIGGAGSIGSSFIRAILPFRPSKLIVIDLNENGLAELTRDLRSTHGMYVPDEYRTYTLNFADPIFARIFREEKGFAEICVIHRFPPWFLCRILPLFLQNTAFTGFCQSAIMKKIQIPIYRTDSS